ncbi:MAG TPA: hypothetical protein DER09_01790 [Prolixibacteraceae bacterium]|nr:hypothetical protein [Prolixibacteraceae bacterium]
MKTISSIFVLLMVTLSGFIAGAKTEPVLKFGENGKLKILQFTDIHFQYNSYRSDSALVLMKNAVETEKPGLVVLTGDVVCSENTKKAWLALTQIFVDAKVPWAVVLGNHDVEYELTSKEIIETITGLPYCLAVNDPERISGSGNYIVPVQSAKSKETKAVLWFLDSHSSFEKGSEMGTYDWIKQDQIQWYRQESAKLTKTNNGKPYPALAFFHIPLPEYKEVWGKEKTVGVKHEDVCSPDINSGMYNAFLESGDVMGMFVGHDHDNNYVGSLREICMVYGQATGRETYGTIGKGYRVIELYEEQRKFDTWVRIIYNADRDKDLWEPTRSSEKALFVTYPDSFLEKK